MHAYMIVHKFPGVVMKVSHGFATVSEHSSTQF